MDQDQTYQKISDRRNLYIISQPLRCAQNTYEFAVVAAWTEHEARYIHPANYIMEEPYSPIPFDEWVSPSQVEVKLIGLANPGICGVICASYNTR